jgi:hypothetical protein
MLLVDWDAQKRCVKRVQTLITVITAIVNRSFWAKISVAKFALMLPKLPVFCVKAAPNLADITFAERPASKLP